MTNDKVKETINLLNKRIDIWQDVCKMLLVSLIAIISGIISLLFKIDFKNWIINKEILLLLFGIISIIAIWICIHIFYYKINRNFNLIEEVINELD